MLSLARLFAASFAWAAVVWPASAQDARTLRVVSPWEIGSLDPSRAGYVFTRLGVAETLVGATDGGLPAPALAASWSASEDATVWRFTLREGARFHDGTPVTAEAAAVALRRARARPGPLAGAPIADILAPDPRTVEIRTSRPFAPLPAFLAHHGTQILAPSSWEGETVRRVVGSGPYRVTRIEPPLRLDAERAEGWTGGPPPEVERVSYQAVGRAETRAAMAEGGQADLVFTLDPPGQDRLRRGGRVEMRVLPIPRVQVLKVNAASPFFADARVRRALSLALDRAGIARGILRNPAAAATQFFPPTLEGWHVPGLEPLRHDPAEARRLLAEAGWRPGPDGVLARDGRAFRVSLRTFSDRPELPVVAAAVQDQLRDLGIEVQVAVLNSGEIPAGHRDGSLEMALYARNLAVVPDPLGTLVQDYGPHGGEWGAMGWSSPDLADALERLGSAADPAERAALHRRVAGVLQTELPVIPLAWYDHSAAVSRRLAEVFVDPLELSYRIERIRWAR